jgi:hypothetical protein
MNLSLSEDGKPTSDCRAGGLHSVRKPWLVSGCIRLFHWRLGPVMRPQPCSGLRAVAKTAMRYESHIWNGRFRYTFRYRHQFDLLRLNQDKPLRTIRLGQRDLTSIPLNHHRVTVSMRNSESARGQPRGGSPPCRPYPTGCNQF